MPTSVLSDGTIRRLVEEGRIKIEPWDPAMVQPASVDLRLGRTFRVFHNFRVPAIDLRLPPDNLTELVEIGQDESFVIHPGEFVLGRTRGGRRDARRHRLPHRGEELAGQARADRARDRRLRRPGFSGSLTLEITNLTRVPIILWPGKPIAQLSFMTLDAPAERPYGHPELGSHYHGQVDATESRYEGGPAKAMRRLVLAVAAALVLAPAAAQATDVAATTPTQTVRARQAADRLPLVRQRRPVVFIQGLAGTIDGWPPSFLDSVAAAQPPRRGLRQRGRRALDAAQGHAEHPAHGAGHRAADRRTAPRRPDVVGWSMGGMTAQASP